MKNRLLPLLFILGIALPTSGTFAADLSLEKSWQLDGLRNPESVVYDAQRKCLYVSNINGSSSARDNNGFISKVSLLGKVIKMRWAIGLNAPKGLAIATDHLYVADIDELVEIELDSGAISHRYPDAEAKFFNDVAAADDGTVYVSDSMTNTIHRLQHGKFTRWLKSPDLRGPNGLLTETDRMLVAAWGTGEGTEAIPGQVLAVSMRDKSITIVGNKKTQGNLDGIERTASGDYFITNWMLGKLLLLKHSGEVLTLLNL